MMHKFAVIFSHADQPEDAVLCMVDARTPGSAQDECNGAVREHGNLFEGYDFTIWPDPVA